MHKKVVPAGKFIKKSLFDKIQKSIPIVCVDLVFFRNLGKKAETLLLKRKIYPEIGKWCVIGGRVLKGEQLRNTIDRQAGRELGVKVKVISPWNFNNPVAVFSEPKADAQKHYVVLVYPVIMKGKSYNESGPEFSEAKWFPINRIPGKMAFKHLNEVKCAIKLLKKEGKING
ncbi:MAG: DUF4916 domain-containing protein [Candidatus Pacebacteria bacterium]|nr:DUF4916 domain-containing protein [Candidatus Paceibacterota bacterium]